MVAVLFALGATRWPREDPEAMPGPSTTVTISTVAVTATTTTAAPTTLATTTTFATTTTRAPDPALLPASVPIEDARPSTWPAAMLAVSVEEAWAAMVTEDGVPSLIGHVDAGNWTMFRLTPEARILGLALAPNGAVWAATDSGAFSYYRGAWIRRFDAPVGGVAVGGDGTVWIGGATERLTDRLWLARWDLAGWKRMDRDLDAAPVPFQTAPMAALPDDEAWITHRAGYWIEDDLMRYDGGAMERVEIPGVPDATPDNGIPAVRVIEIAASADGSLWAVGYLAADPDQAVLARFDGAAWTLFEDPLPTASGDALHYLRLAAGPDGTAWFAFDGGLRSFDGRVWRSYLEGASLFGVDVAPDGTVWYSDAAGLHTLSAP